MRKLWCVAVLTSAAAVLPAASAGAASQTVQGTGDIDKLVVNNAKSALKASLFGLGAPCDAKYMKLTVDWGTKAGYEIDNGCYPGATWSDSLVYLADRSDARGRQDRRLPEAPLRLGRGRRGAPRARCRAAASPRRATSCACAPRA